MRQMTRRAAGLADGGWDATARHEVSSLFGALADEWATRHSPARSAVVADALHRGLPPGRLKGTVIEPGSGLGVYSGMLADRWERAVAIELTPEMLIRAPAEPACRVLADASRLPFAAGGTAAVALINMFLFPAEVERVLSADGVLIWVNSSGENTPIHLMPEEVADALPGEWEGLAARAGVGLWTVLRRVGHMTMIS